MLSIGTKVKELRTSKGMSQIIFSNLCKIPRTTLCDLENGKIKNPTTKLICKVCKGCCITPNDIIPEELYK